jgi:SAM-dependent methyltransferase
MRHTNYDELAETYDRRYEDDDYSGIEEALVNFVGHTSQRVLEVGCGTGHWLRKLQKLNIGVMGVDPSWPMLSRARVKVDSGRVIGARAEDLPFADGQFDRLFCINAHHHFADKRKAIHEAHRVLRTGGSLMMVALDPHTGVDQWWIYDYFHGTLDIDKERYPSSEQIREWMNAAGFVDTHTREVQHLPGDVSARDALETGFVDPVHTSQLAVLTTDEFSAGVARIRAALARDSSMRLSADLRVYGTFGKAV